MDTVIEEKKGKKFYNINKKYLAEALSFLSFHYYQFNRVDGSIFYSFEDTKEFREALNIIIQLKKKYNKCN